ncbi:unnamed protein product [Tetraodon nigroviridis]|uniref:Chromosome 12 SCAF14993, whole genome shotgun sequence n=2 Tax=Tetraodon nigroviridis TaxID=99883 RepID=Q4RUY0_TETNG|nr:unnamed protein product [Tetraodon nigroviridis]
MDCISCQYKKHTCFSGQLHCGGCVLRKQCSSVDPEHTLPRASQRVPKQGAAAAAYNTVQAEEGGQAVLDCLQPWHHLLMGRPEYHFSWAPGVPGTKTVNESNFIVLVVTEDSSLVLNQLRLDEQGTYRCSLQDQNETVFYQVHFLLTVAPLPNQTDRAFITLPPLPLEDDFYLFGTTETFLVPFLAIITGLSLAVVVGLTIFLG